MIYIWVRETLDSEDEEAFLAQAPSDLRPKVALWNATFGSSYRATPGIDPAPSFLACERLLE